MSNPALKLDTLEICAVIREHLPDEFEWYVLELERRMLVLLIKLRAAEQGVSVPAFVEQL